MMLHLTDLVELHNMTFLSLKKKETKKNRGGIGIIIYDISFFKKERNKEME